MYHLLGGMVVGLPCVPRPNGGEGVGVSSPRRKLHFFSCVCLKLQKVMLIQVWIFRASEDIQVNETRLRRTVTLTELMVRSTHM